ncbi:MULTISPECIES: hypothetical protein [Amycolatopsis]|uniref:Uncharacterized protein n=1 Tax=Amycolatopsis dendrobii TaxID=2760662 RepID=A0A7W3W4D6_9PSEU|nr:MULTISPECIES: hypothetical protein [Amycolatopsis]MBB1158057.1 hypothetical protein [Amycolatopsis dendrobii]UKD57149.1 hypothetical protein L3Q65_10620 [Amycolatopsis sp. FU40]
MAGNDFVPVTPDQVRQLASQGKLAAHAAAARGEARRRLRAAVFEIAEPVLFRNLTRKLEAKRGHYRCAAGVRRLDDPCLDRFHNDMDAVIDDIFANARVPIASLEGWIRSRLGHATVDGYRRRRSERGALQRPRVPCWLAAELGRDPVLLALAVDILDFVGTDAAVGPGIWPVEQWAEYRVGCGADPATARQEVARDIAAVLSAMRVRPRWYADYVERPLGRKQPPSVPLQRVSAENGEDLFLVDPSGGQEPPDALTELAAVAVAAITSRIAAGETPEEVVLDVVASVFDDEPRAAEPEAVHRILAAVTAP